MKKDLFVSSQQGDVLLAVQVAALTNTKSHQNKRGLISLGDDASGEGKAVFTATKDESDVEKSIYDWRSFKITNTGSKRIAAVFIDVTDAMIQDIVFDDDGTGGDDVSKALDHDWGTTETNPVDIDMYQWKWSPVRNEANFSPSSAFDPTKMNEVNNLFVDELSDSDAGASDGGYNGALILFEDFDPTEYYEFSGDIDQNSLAGLKKSTTGAGANWEVGGVSGAEMVNGVVTILFGDGSIASGTLACDGSQAGAVAAIASDISDAPGLSVDGMFAPTAGGYLSNPSSVIVYGSPGDHTHVSMVSAFQPMDNSEKMLAGGAVSAKDLVEARLAAQYPMFPVSNAASWQHVDVVIPASGSVDVGASFNYDNDFALGYTAVVLDSSTGVPTSMTADPIRLKYGDAPAVVPTVDIAPYEAAFEHAIGTGLISVADPTTGEGEVVMKIMENEMNVQKSNYNWRSFKVTNMGSKRIAAMFIDVSSAIIQDVVFDDDGSGGDDVAKTLTHDWGTTETNPVNIDTYQWQWLPVWNDPNYNPNAPFNPSGLGDLNNLFVNELSDSSVGACSGGYNRELIMFGDFDPTEFYEFSGDMDPNSIAGLQQNTASNHAAWDVGGVSGAEMVNSVVTVLFGDGSIASGTLASDGSQAGAIATISSTLADAPGLTVDGMAAGASGTYSTNPPSSVVVSASPGDTVRVSMVSAFGPMNNFEVRLAVSIIAKDVVKARLAAQYPLFPVSNADSWQHAEVVIPASGSVDVGDSFSYDNDFALGYTAVVFDANSGIPSSMTSDPIRLLHV